MRAGEFLTEDDNYRIQHRPADKTSGSPMHDLSGVYPDDIYGPNGAQFYGHYGQNNPLDIAAIQKIRYARNNPNKGIQIYRAVPPGVKEILPGDWVTTVKSYAQEHGSWIGPKFKILSRVVKAGDLYTEGNSILEWGWDP